MSYAGVLADLYQEQAAEKLAEEVAAAAAIQSGEIKITEQMWGSIVATNISPLTVSSFEGVDLEQRTKFISALSAVKANKNFFTSFRRTLINKKNKQLFDYLSKKINTQGGGAGGIAVNVMSLSFMAVIGNLLINNGNTALSQGAISEALAQHSPGEWGKFISTTIGISAKESNVPSVLGDPRFTVEYTSGQRFFEQHDKISQVTSQIEIARTVNANAAPNAGMLLFEMRNAVSTSLLERLNTQTELNSRLQAAQAGYDHAQAILDDSVNWWFSSAKDTARGDAAAAQSALEEIKRGLVGHIDTGTIARVFSEVAGAMQQNAEDAHAAQEATAAHSRNAEAQLARLAESERRAAQPPAKTSTVTATATVRPSASPAPAPQNAAEEAAHAAAQLARLAERRLEDAAASREAEKAVAGKMARDLAEGKVVSSKSSGTIKFGTHTFPLKLGNNVTTPEYRKFLQLSGLNDLMRAARERGVIDGSKEMGKFDSNYGVEHAPKIDNPATIFRRATDKLGLTTPEGKSAVQKFAQLVILNEYSIGFEKTAQEKLERLRKGVNKEEGKVAGQEYSAVKVTLKAALLKNGKIAVPDGKGGTRELNDVEVNAIVNDIVETAIGVGKMPKPEKIDAFALEILTQVRAAGKLDTMRRSWFLRAERNIRKSPVEILSDNILLLTLIGTVFGGVAIVGAALENPMKDAMARAANRQGAAAAKGALMQAEAAADESRARAEHQRALTAAAKAQAAALLKVTEAKAASNIARLAANNATNAQGRTRASEKAAAAETALKEAREAKAVADKHLQELKKAERNKTRKNGNNMPGLEGQGAENDEEAAIEAQLAASRARQAAANAAAQVASNAAAAQLASNAAATAAAERAAAALRNSKAAAASPAKQLTAAQLREKRLDAAAKRAGKGGGTRRRRIYRSRTRRHR